MILSRKWLTEFVDLSMEECGDRAFAEAMTISGSKVEVTEASCTVEPQIPNGVLESYTLTLFADATVDGLPLTLEITVTVIFYDLS